MNPTQSLFPESITPQSLEVICSRNQLPEAIGFQFTEVGKNFLKGSLTVDHRHLRPGNIMNGGISLMIIETLGSVASFCTLNTEIENALGIHVNANHLSIARPGDQLTAIATAIHLGKTTHLWEVNIVNQNQKPVSSGRITMLITRK